MDTICTWMVSNGINLIASILVFEGAGNGSVWVLVATVMIMSGMKGNANMIVLGVRAISKAITIVELMAEDLVMDAMDYRTSSVIISVLEMCKLIVRRRTRARRSGTMGEKGDAAERGMVEEMRSET